MSFKQKYYSLCIIVFAAILFFMRDSFIINEVMSFENNILFRSILPFELLTYNTIHDYGNYQLIPTAIYMLISLLISKKYILPLIIILGYLIHILTSLKLYYYLKEKCYKHCTFASLIFLCHPIAFKTITYTTGFSYILLGYFVFNALINLNAINKDIYCNKKIIYSTVYIILAMLSNAIGLLLVPLILIYSIFLFFKDKHKLLKSYFLESCTLILITFSILVTIYYKFNPYFHPFNNKSNIFSHLKSLIGYLSDLLLINFNIIYNAYITISFIDIVIAIVIAIAFAGYLMKNIRLKSFNNIIFSIWFISLIIFTPSDKTTLYQYQHWIYLLLPILIIFIYHTFNINTFSSKMIKITQYLMIIIFISQSLFFISKFTNTTQIINENRLLVENKTLERLYWDKRLQTFKDNPTLEAFNYITTNITLKKRQDYYNRYILAETLAYANKNQLSLLLIHNIKTTLPGLKLKISLYDKLNLKRLKHKTEVQLKQLSFFQNRVLKIKYNDKKLFLEQEALLPKIQTISWPSSKFTVNITENELLSRITEKKEIE